MEDRMNKKELLKLLKALEIDRNEFWILSSGALVMRGLFDDAGDLDIAVTNKGLEQLKSKYDLKRKENGWYIVNEKIECVCNGKKENLKYQPELVEDYYVQNLEEYYQYLINSTREKDKKRISIVEQEMAKRGIRSKN